MRRPFAVTFVAIALLASSWAGAQGPPPLRWMAGGHVGIRSLDLGPDATRLVTGSGGDDTIKIWDTGSGRLLRTLVGHQGGVSAVACSMDGSSIASGGEAAFGGSDVPLKLWRSADGALLRTFGLPDDGNVDSVALSPDGTMLAAGRNTNVELWDVATGALVRTLTGHAWTVFGLDFSPDGTLVASASGDDTARLWRVADGALVHELTGHSFFVMGVAFSPSGATLATASWDTTIKTWDVASGALVRTYTGHADGVENVRWSHDGARLASCDDGATVKVWDVATGSVQRTLTDPVVQSALYGVRFAPDDATVTAGGADGHARRWDVAGGAIDLAFGEHAAQVRGMAVTTTGLVVSGAADMLGKAFRVSDGAPLFDLVGHGDLINAVAVTPDGLVAATAAGAPPPDTRDPTVKLWDLAGGGAEIRTLAGHPGGSACAAFSPDGAELATGGNDGLVKLWRVADGSLARTFAHADPVHAVCWTTDGTTIVSGTVRGLSFWTAADGAFVRLTPTPSAVAALSASRDGQWIAAGLSQYADNALIVRASDGGIERTFGGHASFVQGIAFLDDGTLLLSGSGYDADVREWHVPDGALVDAWTAECGWGPWPSLPIAGHPDGTGFAYGRGDATVGYASFAIAVETNCDDRADDDGDGPVDCADSDCLDAPNCDRDGDGTPNGTDCAPQDPGARAIPGEVPRLFVDEIGGGGVADLRWTDVSASAGTDLWHDVVTGVISELRADRDYSRASCFAQDVRALTTQDARPTTRGHDGFWLLVRAENACGAGPWGASSSGLPHAIDPALCR